MTHYTTSQQLFLFFILLLLQPHLIAQNKGKSKSIWIEDRGSKKEMVIAENEFYHPKEGFIKLQEGEFLQAEMSPEKTIFGRVSEVEKAKTRQKLDEYIKQYQPVLYPKGKE